MFTPQEAEQILREQWNDARQVGGFMSPFWRQQAIERLEEDYGAEALIGWTLIGETAWVDYEEGHTIYLFVKDDDQSLWSLKAGASVYGPFGESFDEIEPTTIEQWLEEVVVNIEQAENFSGI
jgi:hypothetical protein